MPTPGRAHGTNPVFVALDTADLDRADAVAADLAGEVGGFKIGVELFTAHGPQAVRRIAPHGPVFLDLKLHDIPTTVARAAAQAGRLGVALLTVHAAGGAAMIAGATQGLADGAAEAGVAPGRIVAVSVLTSMSDDDLASINAPDAALQAPHLAMLATAAGATGVVCGAGALRGVREAVGGDVLLVTPGVRLPDASGDDHASAATPAAAVAAGADVIVVGRPITGAGDPVAAARAVVASLPADVRE